MKMSLEENRPKFYFKWVHDTGYGIYAQTFYFTKYLPNGDQPGKWLPRLNGKLIKCRRGYHLARPRDISYWEPTSGHLYLVEVRGGVYNGGNKVVTRQFRFLKHISYPSYPRHAFFTQKNVIRALVWEGIELTNLPSELQSHYDSHRKKFLSRGA